MTATDYRMTRRNIFPVIGRAKSKRAMPSGSRSVSLTARL